MRLACSSFAGFSSTASLRSSSPGASTTVSAPMTSLPPRPSASSRLATSSALAAAVAAAYSPAPSKPSFGRSCRAHQIRRQDTPPRAREARRSARRAQGERKEAGTCQRSNTRPCQRRMKVGPHQRMCARALCGPSLAPNRAGSLALRRPPAAGPHVEASLPRRLGLNARAVLALTAQRVEP